MSMFYDNFITEQNHSNSEKKLKYAIEQIKNIEIIEHF